MPVTSQMDGLPLPRRYGAIAAIALGITVAVLDGTIANVALPTIASELHASPAESIWIINAYQLAIIVSLLSFSFRRSARLPAHLPCRSAAVQRHVAALRLF